MHRLALALSILLAIATIAGTARAQEEYPPPQGKGRLVVVSSGAMGIAAYRDMAKQIAQLGYDAVLFDGNALQDTTGDRLKQAIIAASKMPHVLPGRLALVGFSLGGGVDLFFGTERADVIVGDVLWYPATNFIRDDAAWARRLKVPVLMFAGESDTYRNCCLIDNAKKLAAAASAAGKPFDLVTYPNTQHDFIPGSASYNPAAFSDAMKRMADRLKQYFGS